MPTGKKASGANKKNPPDAHNSFKQEDLDQFRRELEKMRRDISEQIEAMRTDALNRTDEENIEEDGSGAYTRLSMLGQADKQNQRIHSIDEALRAINKGTYGVCQVCGELIGKERLHALPFAIRCITCKQDYEKKVAAAQRLSNRNG